MKLKKIQRKYRAKYILHADGATLKPLVCGVAPLTDRGLDELLQLHHKRGLIIYPFAQLYG